MTPASVITASRRRYNALTDTDFFLEAEMYELLYKAEMELALYAETIKVTTNTTTVTGTSQYTVPTNTFRIKRITYDGKKITPINFREDDTVTGNDSDTNDSGNPQYYVYYGDKVELRPEPNAAKTLQWRVFKEPEIHTASTTFSTPVRYHLIFLDYIVSEMHAKEGNLSQAAFYKAIWEKNKMEAKRVEKRLQRGDSFASVMDENSLQGTLIGIQ